MANTERVAIYQQLGIKETINAVGTATVMGGAVLTPKVQAAMDQASGSFASMEDVITKTGKAIAKELEAEAAFVTSGCFAALALSSAAVMTGPDIGLIAQLPQTAGLKNEFLVQTRQRYSYDRCVSVPGGNLIEVGDENGTTRAQIEDVIGTATAGILYPAHLDGTEGTISLKHTVEIGKARNVAVIVDAAFQVYPTQRMKDLATCGADAVCFSAKYMGGPNSVGFVLGTKAFVKTVSLHGFTAFESEHNRAFGRGFKVDRGEAVATVTAMKEWLSIDHEQRILEQERRFEVLVELLGDVPGVSMEQGLFGGIPWVQLRLILDEKIVGKTMLEVVDSLKDGDPSIWVRPDGNALSVAVNTLRQGEEIVVAKGLKEVLTG